MSRFYFRILCGIIGILHTIPYTLSATRDVPSASSFYVPSIPGITQDPNNPLQIFAGHLVADPNAAQAKSTDVISHLYFVMIKNRRIADKRRLMFWFNGGPGCSSFDGLMMEVGPWRMDGKDSFKVTEGGWEEYMTMVYVDQPAGTGFSYTSTDRYVHTLAEASTQFLEFLRNFYQVFPEYKDVDKARAAPNLRAMIAEVIQKTPQFSRDLWGSKKSPRDVKQAAEVLEPVTEVRNGSPLTETG
ncbi:Cell death protease [Termitomyces sp. 'cryptogamus']|nr:Cell death protease [Termitomyces sp. 'cryptogamus']